MGLFECRSLRMAIKIVGIVVGAAAGAGTGPMPGASAGAAVEGNKQQRREEASAAYKQQCHQHNCMSSERQREKR